MGTIIKLKRGLKENLPSEGLLSEPLYCTDTKELFIGTGSGVVKISISTVLTFDDLPISSFTGDIYLVADEVTLYVWTGLMWNPISAYAQGFSSGVSIDYYDANSVVLLNGTVEILQKTVTYNANIILSLDSDLEEGSTRKADTWYYAYVQVSDTNPQEYIAFISETYPTKDQAGNTVSPDTNSPKYHPTLDARFRGSFKTDSSSNITKFLAVGNIHLYIGNYNYILQNGTATIYTGVNCRAFVPITSKLANTFYRCVTNNRDIYLGDADNEFFITQTGSGFIDIPIINDSVYYRVISPGSVSIGIHGYREDI